jgi:hypothetical protein
LSKQSKDTHNKPTDLKMETEQISKRLAMLDHRLDNMDSVITSLVERVMGKPLTMEVTCPKCGEVVQINIMGSTRLHGKEKIGMGD